MVTQSRATDLKNRIRGLHSWLLLLLIRVRSSDQLRHGNLLSVVLNVELLLVLVKIVLAIHVKVVLQGATGCAACLVRDFKSLIVHLYGLQSQVAKWLVSHL